MNSFQIARAAVEARRDHVCDTYSQVKTCPRNAAGFCLTKIDLWRAQNQLALKWNAPELPPARPVVDPAYL